VSVRTKANIAIRYSHTHVGLVCSWNLLDVNRPMMAVFPTLESPSSTNLILYFGFSADIM